MLQQNYLNAMGIITWKLRLRPEQDCVNSSPLIFQLYLAQQATKGYLVIGKHGFDDSNVVQLLDKMLHAIGLRRAAMIAAEEMQLTDQHWILVIGKDLQYNFSIKQVKVFDHPTELLQNPNKKRDAWNDLQYVAKHWIQQ